VHVRSRNGLTVSDWLGGVIVGIIWIEDVVLAIYFEKSIDVDGGLDYAGLLS
jgi:hypothetical protein